MSTAILAARNLQKRFPGVHALRDVSIEIGRGEVVGLVGENGAGKSSLMRILAGVYQPDAGTLVLDGAPVRLADARDATRHGIGMVFQEQSLLPNLSIAENLFLGRERPFLRHGRIDWRALHRAAERQLAKVQLAIDPRTRAGDVSFATRQMVELAKALTLEESASGHLVILLDEPTSVLEQPEIDLLFSRVRALKQRASFVFVSHRLDEVLALSDRVYVMKDGAVVAELPAADADVAQLHALMVGREVAAEYFRESKQQAPASGIAIRAEHLARAGAYRDVSFTLHEGEILGIAGVIGSGREELCRTLAGFAPHASGRLEIFGAVRQLHSPAEAVACGVGYVPRERRTEGLVLFLSVVANISLASLGRLRRYGLIDAGAERRTARDWVERLGIRTPGIDALCLNLSGGNQQKVVLAKWLTARVRVLVLDHPTRGLDVGAKEDVYDLVRALTAEGIAVVLTSDTLEETIGLSHSVLVMRDGRVTHHAPCPAGGKPVPLDLIGYMV